MTTPTTQDGGRPGVPEPFADSFRHHHARLVAALLRVFGPAQLDLAEDVAQEAMLEAMKAWPYAGTPDRPDAWLLRVARNRALDALRHQRMARARDEELRARALARQGAHNDRDLAETVDDDPFGGGDDDRLTLVFLCCHDLLPAPARVALTLKTVCGLSVSAIAAALLEKEATVAQRLSRAKATLQRESARFEMPDTGPAFEARLRSVLDVLYLLFNEGYRAHAGDELVREDLVRDAVWLTHLLTRHPTTDRPEVHALLALMLFCGARLPARQARSGDGLGEVLTLARQDRSLWRQDWIQLGYAHFERSIGGPVLSAWHVEAALASLHARARHYDDTDWPAILRCYDQLVQSRPDAPVPRLNRVVALAKVHGPEHALAELETVADHPRLARYCLLHATRACLLWQLDRHADAAGALERALALAGTEPERGLLRDRLAACRRGEPAPAY